MMTLNSLEFLFFFTAVFAVYGIIPGKFRCFWLLISSYGFAFYGSPDFGLTLAAVTLISWAYGKQPRRDRGITAAAVILCLLPLCVSKYTRFLLSTLRFPIRIPEIIVPLGISFFTFQAIAYIMDVFRGKLLPEENLVNYALFMAYFPKLISGPIEKPGKFFSGLRALPSCRVWDADRIRDGILMIFWGLFQKIVLAERAAMFVNAVYGEFETYGFLELFAASILYTLEIYSDFNGYTFMARGVSRILGIELRSNFRQPYFAASIRDFWHRWHISLTSWFTEYLYIPLGGSRKGKIRKALNTLIVFCVSGLWHGANRNFIAWGFIHGVFQVIGTWIQSKRNPLNILRTFLLVNFAWIFFAAGGLKRALRILARMTQMFSTGTLPEAFRLPGFWLPLCGGLLIVLIVDTLHEKGLSVFAVIRSKPLPLRWCVYIVLIWSVIMLGIYGVGYDSSGFIYAQF